MVVIGYRYFFEQDLSEYLVELRDGCADGEEFVAPLAYIAKPHRLSLELAETLIANMCEDSFDQAYDEIPQSAHDELNAVLQAWAKEHAPKTWLESETALICDGYLGVRCAIAELEDDS